MGGGAAVIAAIGAIAELGLPLDVTGVLPAGENMISGTAFRPTDVITTAAGLTVEITNPDAEGRLILADALWYARARRRDAPRRPRDADRRDARRASATSTRGVFATDDVARRGRARPATRAATSPGRGRCTRATGR